MNQEPPDGDDILLDRVTTSEESNPWMTVALALVAGCLAALLVAIVGYDPPDADIKYDWLSASGAVSSNAYDDILALGQQEGVHLAINLPHGAVGPAVHPRTPGAIFLSLPLLLVDFDALFAAWVGVTVALGVVLLWFSAKIPLGGRFFWILILFFLSSPFLTTLRFAGQSIVVALAVLVAWVLYQARQDLPAGLLLAVAGTLKLFPLFLLIPMVLQKRFRPVVFTVIGLIALNTAGLLLPGVALHDAIEAMLNGGSVWFRMISNGSMSKGLATLGMPAWEAQLVTSLFALAVVAVAFGTDGSAYTPTRRFGSPWGWSCSR